MTAALAGSLEATLLHAVSGVEAEDGGSLAAALDLYLQAHQALSCALDLYATSDDPPLPAIVREACTGLLDTYSARYEMIKLKIELDAQDQNAFADPPACGSQQPSAQCWGAAPHASGHLGRAQQPAQHASHAPPRTNTQSPQPTHPYLCGAQHGHCSGSEPDADGLMCAPRDDQPSNPHGPEHLARGGCEQSWPLVDMQAAGGGVLGGSMVGRGPQAAARGGGAPGGAAAGGGGGAGAVPGGPGCGPGAMSQLMQDVMLQCQRPVPPGGNLDELAGLGSIKEEVRLALLLPMRMPHLFRGIRRPPRNFLLHGPPGTGKTMLVERIASEAGAKLLVVTPSSVLSKWSGESEKQLRAVFDVARALQPCIVFMDEVDGLAPTRGGGGEDPGGRRLLNELLVQMSYLAGNGGSAAAAGGGAGGAGRAAAAQEGPAEATPDAVYIFGATNRLQDCDPALLRRFDRRIPVPLPDTAARTSFLQGVLSRPEMAGHCLGEHHVGQLAERTEGYSGSDLVALCREAAMQPVRELLHAVLAGRGGAGGPGGAADGAGAASGGREADASGGPHVGSAGSGGLLGGGWAVGGAAWAVGGGGEPAVRPLAMQDFEHALGAVRPASLVV